MTHPYSRHRSGQPKAKVLLKSYKLPDFNANGAGQPMVPKTPMAPPTGALGEGLPGIPASQAITGRKQGGKVRKYHG